MSPEVTYSYHHFCPHVTQRHNFYFAKATIFPQIGNSSIWNGDHQILFSGLLIYQQPFRIGHCLWESRPYTHRLQTQNTISFINHQTIRHCCLSYSKAPGIQWSRDDREKSKPKWFLSLSVQETQQWNTKGCCIMSSWEMDVFSTLATKPLGPLGMGLYELNTLKLKNSW